MASINLEFLHDDDDGEKKEDSDERQGSAPFFLRSKGYLSKYQIHFAMFYLVLIFIIRISYFCRGRFWGQRAGTRHRGA